MVSFCAPEWLANSDHPGYQIVHIAFSKSGADGKGFGTVMQSYAMGVSLTSSAPGKRVSQTPWKLRGDSAERV
jgi:hypothetical protein